MTTSASLHISPESSRATRVLLVEDDPADALLVEAMLDGIGEFEIEWSKSLPDVAAPSGHFDCILLDLGLPGTRGLEALERALSVGTHAAVVVLTGLNDESRGAEAVAAGAQDYLVKGSVDGPLLARSILYAVERHRADESARLLYKAEVLRQHNARLERGLLPRTDFTYASLSVSTRYRAGADQALVGGDFYDFIGRSDGVVRAIIGDVSGHGPDEAALGVALRAAWRALVLADVDDADVFSVLNRMIATERHSPEIYATTCMVTVSPDRRDLLFSLAGHPPPLLLDDSPRALELEGGPALGLLDEAKWPSTHVYLPLNWRVLLYTDGIIEGRDADRRERLGMTGLQTIARELLSESTSSSTFLRGLVERADQLNDGVLVDDVALVMLEESSGT